jgi:hypothetical protein
MNSYGKVHVGALTWFTYPGRLKNFSQLIYYGEKILLNKIDEYSE